MPMLCLAGSYRILATGFAHPTVYLKLYPDLRRELTKQAQAARPGKGCGRSTEPRRASRSRASRP